MGAERAIQLSWICSEGAAKQFADKVKGDGGSVERSGPFVPPPDAPDLYSDAQFEPLTVVTVALAAGVLLRYVRELVLDLKGREIAVIDVSRSSIECRRLDVGRASQVIVKAPDGSVSRFAPSDVDKIQDQIKALLPTASGVSKAAGTG